jgi:para-nitrobenzyl esterase
VSVGAILGQEGASAVPIVDGQVLRQQLASAFETGAFNKGPVIDGSNHDEWRLFVALDFDLAAGAITVAEYPFVIAATFGGALAPSVIAHYPLGSYPSPDEAFAAAVTDPTFSCTARLADQLWQSVPTFAYEFNDENAPELFLPPVSFPCGAAHASEVQYLFKLRAAFPTALDADQQALSQAMIGYWTKFASSGDPNSPGAPAWPQYSALANQFQSLAPSTPTTEAGFAADHQCVFWKIP